jgi:septin family protein
LGDLKLLILGSNGIGKTTLANLLLESNDDIVHISGWEGNVLTASTDWLDREDSVGLEKYEPALNVQITELLGYDPQGDVS